jgi:hypothetical protein
VAFYDPKKYFQQPTDFKYHSLFYRSQALRSQQRTLPASHALGSLTEKFSQALWNSLLRN